MNDDLAPTEIGNTILAEDNKMMASFRIDRELWAKFGRLAKNERLTATDILTDYIQRCADNNQSQYAVRMDTYETDKLNDIVTMMVNTAIEASLQSSVQVMIESALAPITEQVEEVRVSAQSQLQAMRTEFEKALSDRILSIEQQEKLAEVKTIQDRVKMPPIKISTTNQEKAIKNTVKSLDPDQKNSVVSARKPMSKGIKRWLEHLKDEKFRDIVQAGISEALSNQEIVIRLFSAGYGKNNNTEQYRPNLASAMKTALKVSNVDSKVN
jgi:hypothetical protein